MASGSGTSGAGLASSGSQGANGPSGAGASSAATGAGQSSQQQQQQPAVPAVFQSSAATGSADNALIALQQQCLTGDHMNLCQSHVQRLLAEERSYADGAGTQIQALAIVQNTKWFRRHLADQLAQILLSREESTDEDSLFPAAAKSRVLWSERGLVTSVNGGDSRLPSGPLVEEAPPISMFVAVHRRAASNAGLMGGRDPQYAATLARGRTDWQLFWCQDRSPKPFTGPKTEAQMKERYWSEWEIKADRQLSAAQLAYLCYISVPDELRKADPNNIPLEHAHAQLQSWQKLPRTSEVAEYDFVAPGGYLDPAELWVAAALVLGVDLNLYSDTDADADPQTAPWVAATETNRARLKLHHLPGPPPVPLTTPVLVTAPRVSSSSSSSSARFPAQSAREVEDLEANILLEVACKNFTRLEAAGATSSDVRSNYDFFDYRGLSVPGNKELNWPAQRRQRWAAARAEESQHTQTSGATPGGQQSDASSAVEGEVAVPVINYQLQRAAPTGSGDGGLIALKRQCTEAGAHAEWCAPHLRNRDRSLSYPVGLLAGILNIGEFRLMLAHHLAEILMDAFSGQRDNTASHLFWSGRNIMPLNGRMILGRNTVSMFDMVVERANPYVRVAGRRRRGARGVFADPNFEATRTRGKAQGVRWCQVFAPPHTEVLEERRRRDWTDREKQANQQLLTSMQLAYLCYISVADSLDHFQPRDAVGNLSLSGNNIPRTTEDDEHRRVLEPGGFLEPTELWVAAALGLGVDLTLHEVVGEHTLADASSGPTVDRLDRRTVTLPAPAAARPASASRLQRNLKFDVAWREMQHDHSSVTSARAAIVRPKPAADYYDYWGLIVSETKEHNRPENRRRDDVPETTQRAPGATYPQGGIGPRSGAGPILEHRDATPETSLSLRVESGDSVVAPEDVGVQPPELPETATAAAEDGDGGGLPPAPQPHEELEEAHDAAADASAAVGVVPALSEQAGEEEYVAQEHLQRAAVDEQGVDALIATPVVVEEVDHAVLGSFGDPLSSGSGRPASTTLVQRDEEHESRATVHDGGQGPLDGDAASYAAATPIEEAGAAPASSFLVPATAQEEEAADEIEHFHPAPQEDHDQLARDPRPPLPQASSAAGQENAAQEAAAVGEQSARAAVPTPDDSGQNGAASSDPRTCSSQEEGNITSPAADAGPGAARAPRADDQSGEQIAPAAPPAPAQEVREDALEEENVVEAPTTSEADAPRGRISPDRGDEQQFLGLRSKAAAKSGPLSWVAQPARAARAFAQYLTQERAAPVTPEPSSSAAQAEVAEEQRTTTVFPTAEVSADQQSDPAGTGAVVADVDQEQSRDVLPSAAPGDDAAPRPQGGGRTDAPASDADGNNASQDTALAGI
ncbi:unnamed protein product [Amoebophrya sp. A120]|nr:unnamed protein product [Amoebophrya sp. A120]|eukprot:GSA120T00016377001.1